MSVLTSSRSSAGIESLSPGRIRLLALDIDHTLTGRGNLVTGANAKAVALAREKGLLVTLITGRRYTLSAQRFAQTLDLEGPLGVHYGRRVISHPSGEILTSHPLPVDLARALIAEAHRFPEVIISVFLGDDLRFEKFPADFGGAAFVQCSEGDLEEVLEARPDEIMSLNVSHSGSNAAARAVGEAAARLGAGRLEYYFDPWYEPDGMVTVLSAAADKGTALVEIASMLGVSPGETAAFGDSIADIPMLEAAGLGVAVGWGEKPVRDAADLVAEGDPETAVAEVIRKLVG